MHKNQFPDHPEIDDIVFGAFIRNMAFATIYGTSPYTPKKLADHCFGFMYDIKMGLLTPVEYDDQV
ncbi:hypothetical protein OIDMADRAFT_58484 [Oidiodendron maius Zn]|uniref:Uncharacterized protein n=1 Tax=Oidiodendron maius (strain Zn) TaxID=913774 RepID=A0A0C3GLD0_OIDMZ|nr:hypothetical protein OIDMADRAFT_58484 [Oidiodendron maius Zn]